ncbi:MAG: hypothetical protein V3V14_01440 [Saprospiraceae bacterium]
MRLRILTILFFLIIGTLSIGQSINTKFGKNRVQYHDDFNNWWQYETENFITIWYGKGRKVAETVIHLAEQDHDEIQNIMEHKTNDKIKIIVFTDLSDFKQSNIGLEETFTSKAGQTKIIGNKMFVYFDGNHNHLRTQIREGIASVYLNAMLFGDNFQEIVQNAVLLDLPEWYKSGIISYSGRYWDSKLDDELRDIISQNNKYTIFENLAKDYPKIAGHSMWFYLDQNYGKSSISNLLYLTRITRNLDNAFLYVMNSDIKQLSEEWAYYYNQHYSKEKGRFEDLNKKNAINLKNKSYVPISMLRLSPNGSTLAYAYNQIGKFRINIKDLNTGKEKTIFKYGHKNSVQETDYNYPLISWSESNSHVTFLYEHKDVIKLRKYNVNDDVYEEQIIPTDFQRIYSISAIDEHRYLFSASTNGFSDLYIYDMISRQYSNITDDFYDDLDAEVVNYNGVRSVVFSSTRKKNHLFKMAYDTILATGTFDIFLYNLEADDKSIIRVTNTPNVSERHPHLLNDNWITYLSNESGINNRYVVSTSNPSSYYCVSNKRRNIINHNAIKGSNKHIYSDYINGAYKVYVDSVDWKTPIIPYSTRYTNRQKTNLIGKNIENEVFVPYDIEDAPQKIEKGYEFQSRFGDPNSIEPIRSNAEERQSKITGFSEIFVDDIEAEEKRIEPYVYSRATAANLKFRLDNFTMKMDNDILFEGLESYTGNSAELLTNPIGLLLKANIKDLFEDYNLEAGMRFPLSFNGSEYFLTFENRKKLIDKKYALYRKSQTELIDPIKTPNWKAKKVSLLGLYQVKLPFNVYRSVRATGSLRFDKLYSQSVDEKTFSDPVSNEKRLSLKLEYIYDNTIDIALNIKHGTRYKFFVEAINEFKFDLIDGIDLDPSIGFTSIIGFDARHYFPVFRHSVFAVRAAGATSFGSKNNLYYLGGVNNSFSNSFNEITGIPEENFAYKTNVHHLRGFDSNVRNGTSYTMINTELRLPVFRYFMGNYGGSRFLRNFQFVMFYDIGSAWHGSSPYSDANPLNTVTIQSPPVLDITIRYYRDPLVMGYGAGLRARLFGYFLRLDYAHGVETKVVQKPKIHLSIGMDF